MCFEIVSLQVRYCCFFLQAEDGIRDLVRSRGLGDVYKRQGLTQITIKECRTTGNIVQGSSFIIKNCVVGGYINLSLIHI